MRMLERKRLAKHYQTVPGDDDGEHDLELGEGVGPQESGTVSSASRTLEQEVDNWDENVADNWEDDEPTTGTEDGDGPKTPSASSAGDGEPASKKRAD